MSTRRNHQNSLARLACRSDGLAAMACAAVLALLALVALTGVTVCAQHTAAAGLVEADVERSLDD